MTRGSDIASLAGSASRRKAFETDVFDMLTEANGRLE